MILKRISLLNYKNISQCELNLSPKLNCFIGNNGEGKTNFLDAVYFMSFCKSATNAIDSQNISHNEEFMLVQGWYEADNEEQEEIYSALKRGRKKQFKRNKKEYKRLAEHIGLIPLVMVSPSDTELIGGASEGRRRFMDVIISQYDRIYLESLIRYNKALLQRNALLKQEQEPDAELLLLWEESMAREGELIYAKRTEFVEAIAPIFKEFYRIISQDKEEVDLRYVSHGQRGDLLFTIQVSRAKERIVGYSLHGIHKDDLEMYLGDFLIRREGSQGQNKSYLIALKLAQFDFLRRVSHGVTPLLLLDDIFDKLDARRVEEIVKLVSSDRFGQIFITDTNRDHLDKILAKIDGDYSLFEVESGDVKILSSRTVNEKGEDNA